MDAMTRELRESMASLFKVETSLHAQRAKMVNHCADASISGTAKSMPFLSMEESYILEEREYRKILDSFLSLLQATRSMLRDEHSVANRAEIASNEALSVPLSSPPAVDPAAYSQDESSGSSKRRQFAASMATETETESECTVSGSGQSDDGDLGVPEPAEAMQHRESVVLLEPPSGSGAEPEVESQAPAQPQPQPECKVSVPVSAEEDYPALPGSGGSSGSLNLRQPITARVSRNVAVRSTYKYSGNGFGIWKRFQGQEVRTATELYCTKAFSETLSETEYVRKLKRYLVARGGFDAKRIKTVRPFLAPSGGTNARIIVEGPMESIEDGIERIEAERRASGKGTAVKISKLRRNQRSNRLMVKNFDILTKNDHRKFTELFADTFGPLRCDPKMGRDRDGVNFAVLTFCEMEDARKCERMQNDELFRYRNYGETMCFNGRELLIGYAAERESDKKRTRKTRNGRKW